MMRFHQRCPRATAPQPTVATTPRGTTQKVGTIPRPKPSSQQEQRRKARIEGTAIGRALATFCIPLLHSPPALAQRAGENVVAAAKNAFGTSVGNEQIGLYGASEVRGFSPIDAGNVRIEGFSFDRQGSISSRLVKGSTVHIGLTAQGYPFPAPTGIVDYQLRRPGNQLVLSVLGGVDDYGGPFVEMDAQVPLISRQLGVAAGISYAHEQYYDGSNAQVASLALIPHWRPVTGVEVTAFSSLSLSRDEEVAPLILSAGPYLPPRLARRRYYGQQWADLETNVLHLGLLTTARLNAHWEAAAAVLHSVREAPTDYLELFENTQRDGTTREIVVADPPQRRAAQSVEASLSWTTSGAVRSHRLLFRARARAQARRIGGSSPAMDLGPRILGVPEPAERPSFQLGPAIGDTVRQGTVGLSYEAHWAHLGQLTLGAQGTAYDKTITLPDEQPSKTEAHPWLANAALALHLADGLVAYGGFTRGLEETGIAPGNATNRNQAPPAIVTRQIDSGIRWSPGDSLRVVAGLFEVRKPNFATNEQNVFTELGEVRHRGIELSLTGEPFRGLRIVAGAVFMQPRVSGSAVRAGLAGEQSVGQTGRTLRVNGNYQVPLLPGVSIDIGVVDTARRVASSDNRVFAPPVTKIDIGARHQFSFFGNPSTLRFLVKNVTNAYGYRVVASNAFRTNSPRALSASWAMDL